MSQFLQAIINGLALGGMYTVLVLGFSIIWGVLGVINFAHGEFVMAGAYLAWLANESMGIDPFIAAPAVFAVMTVVGFVLQKVLINRVIDRPHLVSLLVMFAVSIILANGMKLIFSADFRRNDAALDGSWKLADGVTIPVTKFFVLIFAIAIMVLLAAFLQRTRLGKSIRAAAQNREAVQIVGIDVRWVYAIGMPPVFGAR